MPDIADRFKRIVDGTQSDFAKKIGVDQSRISEICKKKSGLSSKVISRLSELGYSIDWLLTGKGGMFVGHEDKTTWEENAELIELSGTGHSARRICVNFNANASVEAGFGSEGSDDGGSEFLMPAEIFPSFAGSTIFCRRVEGDSMEPDFRRGDLVFFVPEEKIREGVAYVINYAGQLIVKEIQSFRDSLILISRNASYRPRELCGEELQAVKILGRVVGQMRVFR